MNLDAIKSRLDALNQENGGRVDNSDKMWKPAVGKTTIRIVPSAYDPEDPFTELKFHNTIAKFPILALSNFGEQDPVEDLIEKLRETSDKENWSLSGKISPRPRYFVPVIVRGEEEKGVRIWSISTTIYKALLTIAADEEYGDFTDIVNGFDMVVEKTPAAGPGQFPEITVRAKRNSSPLSDNKAEIKQWLSEQPKPIELFRKSTYDFIKKQLKAYLEGKSLDGAAEATGEAKAEVEKPAAVKAAVAEKKAPAASRLQVDDEDESEEEAPKPVAKKKQTKANVSTKFDDLFGDEEEPGKGGDEDELPF